MSDPLPDVLAEARILTSAMAELGIRARLLGGCGIALHAHQPIPSPLARTYGDIDFVVRRADHASFRRLIEARGYEPDGRFNAANGHHRLLHYDRGNIRQLDTFIGQFRMCHTLDLDDQLPPFGAALAPADLLLTKLQVVEINDKDLRDTAMLLLDHPVGSGDPEAIDSRRLAKVVGGDWGWYTTLSDNLAKLESRTGDLEGLDPSLRDLILGRIADIRVVIDRAPKTLGWKARAKVGRRVPWYDLPEEVTRN